MQRMSKLCELSIMVTSSRDGINDRTLMCPIRIGGRGAGRSLPAPYRSDTQGEHGTTGQILWVTTGTSGQILRVRTGTSSQILRVRTGNRGQILKLMTGNSVRYLG